MAAQWRARLDELLREAPLLAPQQVIERVAAWAFEMPEAEARAWLDDLPAGLPPLADLYLRYLLDNEGGEARRLLHSAAPHGSRFLDVADEKGRIGYERVADMFVHVDFSRCERMVMVGCGPLPVTALHVTERTAVRECVLLDVSGEAVQACEALRHKFGWTALAPRVADGSAYDYAGAQVVFVANVVRPKAATLQRIAQTAGDEVQIVLREPWSLGQLWAERAEPRAGGPLEVVARGPVSRHLSRDVILRRRRPALRP